MVTRYQAGVIGEIKPGEHDMGAYHESMELLEFDKAINEVWLMVRSLNQYIEQVKPWEIAKHVGKDPESEAHLSEVLSYAVGAILQIGDLLVPFLYDTAEKIHKIFGSGTIVPIDGVLFPKIYNHTHNPSVKKV
jgi:methionyl-tRNA synthetase